MVTLLDWNGGLAKPALTSSETTITTDGRGYPNPECLEIAAGGTANYVRLRDGETTTLDNFRIRFYMKTPAAWPSASFGVLGIYPNLSTIAGSLVISGSGAPGQVRLVTGSTVLASSPNNTLAVDTWYMFEVGYSGVTNTMWIACHSTEVGPTDELWYVEQTHANFLPYRQIQLGKINNSPTTGSFLLDTIKATDVPPTDARIGRHADDPWFAPELGWPLFWDTTANLDAPTPVHTGPYVSEVPGGGWLMDTDRILYDQAASGASWSSWPFLGGASMAKLRFQLYVYMPAEWPSSAFNIVTLTDAALNTKAAMVLSGVGQPGSLRLSNASNETLIKTPNGTLELGKVYVMEMHYDSTTSRARIAIYKPGLWSPFWSSEWFSDPSFVAPAEQILTGRINSNPVTTYSVAAVLYDPYIAEGWFGRNMREVMYFTYYKNGVAYQIDGADIYREGEHLGGVAGYWSSPP